MTDQAKFLTGNTLRHVTVMAFSASIGLMAVFMVDFVDMVFISMLGKAELAAAVGYAGTILFFTGSFNIGIAIACGALVARALGQGDRAMARRRATNSIVIGFALGMVFAALVWANVAGLVSWLGATGETRRLAISFMNIMLPSLPILLIGIVAGAVLRAYGDARRSMNTLLIGGVVNAVLDPILIFGLNLDLTGAAMASVAARVTIAATALWAVHRHHSGFMRPNLPCVIKDFRPIMAIAAPAVLTQLATPVGQGYVTRAMAEYGESAVAGMAIIGRLTPVAFATIFALSGAVGPIIGQNAGAGQHHRVRDAFRDALIFTTLVVVGMSALLFALRPVLAGMFGLDGGIAQTLLFLFAGPLSLLWFFNGVIFVSNAACNNLGHPFYSTWINWGRHTLGTIPFVMAGAAIWGAQGVLIGQAVGGIVFGLAAWWLALRVINTGSTDTRPEYERGNRLFRYMNLRR